MKHDRPHWTRIPNGFAFEATVAILFIMLVGILLVTCGCAANTRANFPSSFRAPVPSGPSTQPAAPAVFDVQQLAGQVVTAVQADLRQTVEASVAASVQGIGYNSEFGIGATFVVGFAGLGLIAVTLTALRLAGRVLDQSHERAMARIGAEQ